MKRIAILEILILVACTVWAADTKLSVPELEKGDILICEEYPYRTVKNTSHTVYQIARLGFTNVTSFQDANGLKADGVIGPKTQLKADSEFNKQFNVKPQKYIELNMLSLFVNLKMKESNIAVTITMRNKSDDSLRIVGSIIYDSDGRFLFQDPTLSLSSKICTRKNGKTAYAFVRHWADVMVCAKGTTVKPLKQVPVTASLTKLKPNQSGWMTIDTAYIDSTLSTGTVNVGSMIPNY